jgi:Methylamine utilisation protein MauE.
MSMLIDILSGAASVLLVAAGTLKLGRRTELHHQIVSFDILPSSLVGVLSSGLPVIEILAGGGSLLGNRLAQVLSAVLYLGFSVAVGLNLVRGRVALKCGCFGSRGQLEISLMHVSATLAGSLFTLSAVFVEDGAPILQTVLVAITIACVVPLLLALKDVKRIATESQLDFGG